MSCTSGSITNPSRGRPVRSTNDRTRLDRLETFWSTIAIQSYRPDVCCSLLRGGAARTFCAARHPALPRAAQVALTLRVVCGFTAAQIARAFLVRESTVAQRITRAKQKITDAGIPYRIPSDDEFNARLSEVLQVIYLLLNEGYLPPAIPAFAPMSTATSRVGIVPTADGLSSGHEALSTLQLDCCVTRDCIPV
jgi:Sigma-70, region 4